MCTNCKKSLILFCGFIYFNFHADNQHYATSKLLSWIGIILNFILNFFLERIEKEKIIFLILMGFEPAFVIKYDSKPTKKLNILMLY